MKSSYEITNNILNNEFEIYLKKYIKGINFVKPFKVFISKDNLTTYVYLAKDKNYYYFLCHYKYSNCNYVVYCKKYDFNKCVANMFILRNPKLYSNNEDKVGCVADIIIKYEGFLNNNKIKDLTQYEISE